MPRFPLPAPGAASGRQSICAWVVVRIAVVFAVLLPMMYLAPSAGSAQEAPAAQTQASYADHELRLALDEADLLREWIDAGSVSDEAALVEVLGSEAYDEARAAFLSEMDRLIERGDHIEARAAQAERLANDVSVLEEVARDLRREIAESGRSAAVSLTPQVVAEARRALDSITSARRWLSISLDPYSLAEDQVVRARDELARQVDSATLLAPQDAKTRDAIIASFTAVHQDLQRVTTLIEATVQRSLPDRSEFTAHRASIVETMAGLHEVRLLGTTSVGGLPVVTLDAYVRGSHALDPVCPVDWALLAGIGRVESRHGTIDDTVVQRSGRVSKPILGPLLDGGATAREAAATVRAAAEAEEALLLAELEAAEDAEAAAQAAFEALVWGEEVVESVDDTEAEPEPREPLHDPLLWGDDLPYAEDDLAPVDDDDQDEEVEDDEPEFRGNGFAVIADSDNGRLDGNSRWDRAVGPMQFIPETWSYWETDGNGDGVVDPQNMYDAAATAGRFLCHLSRTRGSAPSSFVLGYNSSQTYVRNVLAVRDAFAANDLPVVG